jgi:hypothetical protein
VRPFYRKLALVLAGSAALISLIALTAVFGTVFWRITTSAHGATGDYIAFYAAGSLVRGPDAAGLYDAATIEAAERALYPGTFDEPFGFVLPVFVAWAFAPLSMLPYTPSFLIWMAINAALLALILIVTERTVLREVPQPIRLVLLGAAAISMPALATIMFGQVDFIVLAGLLLGYLLLCAKRPWLAGLALCLVLVKPHFLVGVALLLVATREWRPLAVLAGAGVPLLMVPAVLAAPETLLDNARMLAAFPGQSDDMSVNAPVMANWRGFIISLTNSTNTWYWAPGLAVIGCVSLAIAWPRLSGVARGSSSDQAFSLAVLLPLILSPHLHTQSLSLLLIPAALALRAYWLGPESSADRAAIVVTAVFAAYAALFLLPFFAIQGLSLTFFGLAATFAAVALRWPGATEASAARERVLPGAVLRKAA